MPYIPQIRRDEDPQTPGELNYQLTCCVLDYCANEQSYGQYNYALGVLTALQFEVQAPTFGAVTEDPVGLSRPLRRHIKAYLDARPPRAGSGADIVIVGVLEAVKCELYRRHIGPYEDRAIQRNGDVCYDKSTGLYR